MITIVLFAAILHSYSQTDKANIVSFDGMYIAKTGRVETAKVDIYTYLRLYRDGTVYLQAVTSNDPQVVASWFGRYKKFSQKGRYQISGSTISMQLSNKESDDYRLEGLQETTYKGAITSGNQMCLVRDTESIENCFNFSIVTDTTTFKYTKYKPEIQLPGDWKVKQILKNSGQIIFTNEDSTIIAIAILKASNLAVYKEMQTEYETAYAYYDWDSQYMRDTQKMEVKKISEDKDKAFVIWNAKDVNNDNNYLFARHKDLLYNFMIYDKTMPVEKQLHYLKQLYDTNKD